MSEDIEKAITDVTSSLNNERSSRFLAIKLLERDPKIKIKVDVEKYTKKLEEEYDDEIESIITSARYEFIEKVVNKAYIKKQKLTDTLSDKIDKIVTNRILALPIFVGVMAIVYYISVTTIGTMFTDWTNDVLFGEIIPPAIESFLISINCVDWLQSLILNGVVAGLGAVLGFVPQILVLFILLAILEECGYMARIAFIMDRIFRKFGLSGKSFIPMLIGTGCGVPAIMASRTIENERDRRMTIMTTTFIPCSAKLPIILKKTKPFIGEVAPFIMELPAYHIPKVAAVLRSTWERGWSFIKKAGTVIFLSTIIIWFVTNFGFVDGSFRMLEPLEIDYSIGAVICSAISFIFIPLGFGNWQSTLASIMGLVAKENLVATYGIALGFEEVAEAGDEFWNLLPGMMTAVGAYSLLAFNLLCSPCFAAIGAIKREMNNMKWTLFAIGYQCVFAYVIALIINQIGSLIIYGSFNIFTVVAIVMIVVLVYLLFRRPKAYQEALKGKLLWEH